MNRYGGSGSLRSSVWLTIFLIMTFGRTGLCQSAGSRKPLVPLAPTELLKMLPPPPTGWRLVKSTANNYFMGWLCAQATREYEPTASNGSGKVEEKPAKTILRLMDTGYYPAFNGDFENFKVGKFGAAESLVVEGMPARRFTLGPAHQRIRLSLRGRFIVEIETTNQPPASLDSWLRLIDFKAIETLPDSGADALPVPIIITKVDELKPANNSSSKLYWHPPTQP